MVNYDRLNVTNVYTNLRTSQVVSASRLLDFQYNPLNSPNVSKKWSKQDVNALNKNTFKVGPKRLVSDLCFHDARIYVLLQLPHGCLFGSPSWLWTLVARFSWHKQREWLLNDLFSFCGKFMICCFSRFQGFQAVPKRGLKPGQNEVPKFHPRFPGKQPSTLLFPYVLRNAQRRERFSFSSSSTSTSNLSDVWNKPSTGKRGHHFQRTCLDFRYYKRGRGRL